MNGTGFGWRIKVLKGLVLLQLAITLVSAVSVEICFAGEVESRLVRSPRSAYRCYH